MERTVFWAQRSRTLCRASRYRVANLFGSAKIEGARVNLFRSLPVEKDYLILKRASASRPSGEWNEDDFDVLAGARGLSLTLAIAPAPSAFPAGQMQETSQAQPERQL
jgi:hypothetical protein